MSDFLEEPNDKPIKSPPLIQWTRHEIVMLVEDKWEYYLVEQGVDAFSTTVSILFDTPLLRKHSHYFFQSLVTLLELNMHEPIPNWDCVVYLKNQIAALIPHMKGEFLTDVERDGFFKRREYYR